MRTIAADYFTPFSTRFAGLFWCELMGMTTLMCYLAPFAGYLALLLCVHRRKTTT